MDRRLPKSMQLADGSGKDIGTADGKIRRIADAGAPPSGPDFGSRASIDGPEAMYRVITEFGIVPFFKGPVPGCSIEEATLPGCWIDSDSLGPWDWKIDVLRSGDIAYGKFLLGGKAAFATVKWYRELMNYRRGKPRYTPEDEMQQKAYSFILDRGSATVKELRLHLGLNKSKVDALLTQLQMDTLVVIGDIQRVYRGADLQYSGWQTASFCTPDALFANDGIPFFKTRATGLSVDHPPEESYRLLCRQIRTLVPDASDRDLARILG